MLLIPLDDSLRSPFGPPYGRSTRYALLSRFRGNDDCGINQSFPHFYCSGLYPVADSLLIGRVESLNLIVIIAAVLVNHAALVGALILDCLIVMLEDLMSWMTS
jgi:hypothetical protein